MRRHPVCALILLCTALWAGCDDAPTVQIFPAPPREDMPNASAEMGGVDMGVEVDMSGPAPCEGLLEGERCGLTHASGVCVLGRCQLVTCEFGWQDCDGRAANGCERDITQPSACGACERACRAEERCALAERSWVCTSGTVCAARTFDVDRSAVNGCEWGWAQGADTGLLSDEDAQVALTPDGAAWVASTPGDARRVGWTGAPGADSGALLDAQGTPLPAIAPRRVAAHPVDALAAVAWGDRVTLHRGDAAGVMTAGHFESACAGIRDVAWSAAGELHLTVGQTLMTVGQDEIAASCMGEGGCVAQGAVFGPADYLRAFYPYPVRGLFESPALVADPAWSFGAAEIARCAAPCLLDQERGAFLRDATCLGAGQCSAGAPDPQSCEVCDVDSAAHCPRFAPVRLLPLGADRMLVVTERGVVALQRVAAGWRPRGRVEAAFDPDTAGGVKALDAALHARADGTARLFVWMSGGFVRALEVRWDAAGELVLRPAWADVGVSAATDDVRPARIAAWGGNRAVVVDDRHSWLIGYTSRGATVHALLSSDLASVARQLGAQVADDGGLWIAGDRFGLLATWRIGAR
jgi:hypothetical protein